MSAPTSSTPPRLRAGVMLDVAGRALVDAVFVRKIKLDDAGLAILGALDGDASIEEVAGRAGVDVATVSTWLSRLMAYDLLDGERARARMGDRQGLARVKAAPGDHLRPLSGARFSCTMCGSCCGGHVVGPVSRPILDGLAAHGAALENEVKAARKVDKGLFFVLPTQRATPGEDVVCHAAGGSCVFLDDQGLCRIHGKLGGDKKPLPCRIFPWELTASPTGVRVAVQRECRDFANATNDERPTIAESEAELRALLAEIPGLWTPSITPVLRDDKFASWADYEALEAELLALCEVGKGAEVVPTFAAFSARVGQGPASDGATFQAWRDGLLAPLKQILAAVPESDDEVVFRVDALTIAVRALEEARGWALIRATAPLDPAALALFHSHLRHSLWSLSPLRATSLAAGLARLHAEWLLARLMATSRAREVKRFHVTAQDLQDGLANACFLFRHRDLTPILERLDPLTTAVYLDKPDEPRMAADRELDTRTELPKF